MKTLIFVIFLFGLFSHQQLVVLGASTAIEKAGDTKKIVNKGHQVAHYKQTLEILRDLFGTDSLPVIKAMNEIPSYLFSKDIVIKNYRPYACANAILKAIKDLEYDWKKIELPEGLEKETSFKRIWKWTVGSISKGLHQVKGQLAFPFEFLHETGIPILKDHDKDRSVHSLDVDDSVFIKDSNQNLLPIFLWRQSKDSKSSFRPELSIDDGSSERYWLVKQYGDVEEGFEYGVYVRIGWVLQWIDEFRARRVAQWPPFMAEAFLPKIWTQEKRWGQLDTLITA